jgi:prefoldin alpha subunit
MDEKKQEFQKKYAELQQMDKQIRQMQTQFQNLENQLIELHQIKKGLEDLGNTKIDNEILTPVSPGIFAKLRLIDNKELIVNVGANVAVKRTIPETQKMIDKQIDDIRNFQTNIINDMQDMSEQGTNLEKEVNTLLADINK